MLALSQSIMVMILRFDTDEWFQWIFFGRYALNVARALFKDVFELVCCQDEFYFLGCFQCDIIEITKWFLVISLQGECLENDWCHCHFQVVSVPDERWLLSWNSLFFDSMMTLSIRTRSYSNVPALFGDGTWRLQRRHEVLHSRQPSSLKANNPGSGCKKLSATGKQQTQLILRAEVEHSVDYVLDYWL